MNKTKESVDYNYLVNNFMHNEEFKKSFDNWVFDLGLKTKTGSIPDWFNLAYVLQFAYKKSLEEYADWKIKECLPEKGIEWQQEGTRKELRGYTKGFNDCIDQILINKDKK
jgi:hypothetical protein